MTSKNPVEQYHSCAIDEKNIVSLLALHGEPLGKTRLLEYMRRLGIKDPNGKPYAAAPLAETLARMRRKSLLVEEQGSGFICPRELQMTAIRSTLDDGTFEPLCAAIDAGSPVSTSYDGYLYLRTYRQGIARLRMALLRGQTPEQVYPWLAACSRFLDFDKRHPYVEVCGQPFTPDLFERLHPLMQQDVMAYLLAHTLDEPQTAPPLREWAKTHLKDGTGNTDTGILRVALAGHWLACGCLEDAAALIVDRASAGQQFLHAAILLLRGDHGDAVSAFDLALKTLRKESGKRNIFMTGLCGYLYVLAMMRSEDPKYKKLADTYLDLARRAAPGKDLPVIVKLHVLRQVQTGMLKPEAALELERSTGATMLPRLFQALLRYWLGLPANNGARTELLELFQRAESAGFHLIAAQAAELLDRHGERGYGEQAAALRKRYRFVDMCDWFERQEPWQRQLSALMDLRQSAAAAPKPEAQTAW